MNLLPEIKSLVQEYIAPTIWTRDGTLTVCTINNSPQRTEVYKRQRLSVTPGLWKMVWSPLTARNVKRLYRCLIIYFMDKAGKDFNFHTLLPTLECSVNPYITDISFADKLILYSGETTHDIDLNASPEEIKRLGIYNTQIGSIHADIDHTSGTTAKVIIIPISYSYKAMEGVKESLLSLYRDPSFLRKEVKKLVPDARINKGNVISIPVHDANLYVNHRRDFNRILIERGTIYFKEGSRVMSDSIERALKEYATPLLRNIIGLEAMSHNLHAGFYLSPQIQEVAENAIMDPRFSVQKKIIFSPDLRYSIEDKTASFQDIFLQRGEDSKNIPQPRSAYIIFSQHRRDSLKRENADLDSTTINKLLALEWQNMNAKQQEMYHRLHNEEKARYMASLLH